MNRCQYCSGAMPSRAHYYCGLECQIKAGCHGTEDPEGCWVWARATRENGYGLMRVKIGDRYRMRSPARVMYAVSFGEVPFTASVVNMCKSKNCCNPKHLRLKVQELQLDVGGIDDQAHAR